MLDKYFVVADNDNLCGETPMWDWKKKEFWWSDMLGKYLCRYNPKDGSIVRTAEGKNVSGFTMNKGGGLVCATHQGVFLWDEANGYRLIAEEFQENRLNCNDATADAKGRFLFGNTFYGPHCKGGDYPLGKLFMIDTDGTVSILEEGIHLSNGLGFSPDNRTLYYTDTTVREIYAYDYHLEKGGISNKRIFVKVPDDEGIPDGLTVDAEGYVWSAQWYGSCVVRYDPDGKVERRIKTPAMQTSSVMFGGDDFTDLYVTTASLGVKLHCAPKGYDFGLKFAGGPVYRYNFGIPGKPEYFADIKL